jgi:hypothetical protein
MAAQAFVFADEQQAASGDVVVLGGEQQQLDGSRSLTAERSSW